MSNNYDIGINIILDPVDYKESLRKYSNKNVYWVNGDKLVGYDSEKIYKNIKNYTAKELKNSLLRNIENFIIKKSDKRIFICSDCPVTVNYFSKKYVHVEQYSEEDISESYSKFFINGDTSMPYLRKHNEIELEGRLQLLINRKKTERILKDYSILINCNEVFLTLEGVRGSFNHLDIPFTYILLEHQVMENLGMV